MPNFPYHYLLSLQVLLSLGQFSRALELMLSMRQYDRAACFVEALIEFGIWQAPKVGFLFLVSSMIWSIRYWNVLE